ncbi:MAG: hypothetical protein AAGE59_16265 [Cyanobacteria bacterium P01_F01_bin.86]
MSFEQTQNHQNQIARRIDPAEQKKMLIELTTEEISIVAGGRSGSGSGSGIVMDEGVAEFVSVPHLNLFSSR